MNKVKMATDQMITPHIAWDGPVIELQNVSRYFDTTCAVDDVSFSVPRGKVFGYIGPNGAGKTTSMRILATLEIPSQGDARIEGLSSVNDPDRVRTRLGFMPDAFGTYRNTNCAEYLDFYARSHGLIGRQRTARMRWVMDFTGLRPLADKPIRGLSKGMRQRLCLGRALMHDPSVLILDEPAAGLDPRARIELRKIIRTLAADGKTILVSSHILTELAEMCDSVGIIEQGRLLATGSVDEIRGDAKTHRHICIETIGETQSVVTRLEAKEFVTKLRVDGSRVFVSMSGDQETQADLLKELLDSGIRILQYRSDDQSLEDVFLSVTKGQVQ